MPKDIQKMLDFDILEQITIIRQTLAPLRLTRWQMFKSVVSSVFRKMPTIAFLLSLSVGFAFVYILWKALNRPKDVEKLGMPILGGSKQHRNDFASIVEEGRRKYPSQPYIIKTQDLPYVVFPTSMFDEIKKLPHHIASGQEFQLKTYFGQYTTPGTDTPAFLKAVSIDLARSIPIKVPTRQEDARDAADDVFGYCEDWKEFKLFPTTAKMISMMNGSTFLGREVGRSDRWVELVGKLPFQVMVGTFMISRLPRWIQTILAPIIYAPAIITKWRMKWAISGVIKKDIEDFRNAKDKKSLLRLTEEGKVPLTAALMSRYTKEEATLDRILQDYVIASFVSTPSSAAALYLTMMELANHPNLIEVLREELQQVMVEGKLPKTHLGELRKMDSVMRESARANPFSLLALYRLTMVPLRLSAGPELPKGTLICVDVHHINNSRELWEKPEEFNGLRFHELRKETGKENKHQFVSTGNDSPGWGDGPMACPGRLFANSTIKIALAHLIMNYDFKFAPGEQKPVRTTLPNGTWNPGLDAKLVLKSRK